MSRVVSSNAVINLMLTELDRSLADVISAKDLAIVTDRYVRPDYHSAKSYAEKLAIYEDIFNFAEKIVRQYYEAEVNKNATQKRSAQILISPENKHYIDEYPLLVCTCR